MFLTPFKTLDPTAAGKSRAETITGLWVFSTHPEGLDHTQLANIGNNSHDQIDAHIANTSNPHSVTATQIGAPDKVNPSVADNIVSFLNATGGQKDSGVSAVAVSAHLADSSSPHGSTLTQASIDITQVIKCSGDITPSQITSNQDDYNPTGLVNAAVLRLSSDASRNITGLATGADGKILFLHNVGSNDIVLKDEDANSLAFNRFALNSDVTIEADNLVIIQYDSTSSRWRVVAGGSGGGTSDHSALSNLNWAAAGHTIDEHIEIVTLGKTLTYPLTNKSGASTVIGYAYRFDPDNASSFDYGSEDEDTQVVIAMEVASDSASCNVAIGGQIVDVYVDGDTSIGQYGYFSGTSGQLKPSWERNDGALVQFVASRSGSGLIKAYILPREIIRKWSWLDEPTWAKKIALPLDITVNIQKLDTINPIISIGAGGSWEDTDVGTPCAIIKDNEVKVYYYGSHGGDIAIGLATAPLSGIEGTYTKSASNPILTATEAWEVGVAELFSPAVVYDKEAAGSGTDLKYKMWYIGSYGHASNSAIGYAYSSDGESWTKYASNPVITHGFGDTLSQYPAIGVTKIGKIFILGYRNAAGTISMAYSADGINWSNIGVVLSLGTGGSWDDSQMGFPRLYHSQGNLYITYAGYDGTDYKNGMGVISIADFFTGTVSFGKYFQNPLFDPSNPGSEAWDNGWHLAADLVQLNNVFYFFYDARTSGGSNRQIGLAYIK